MSNNITAVRQHLLDTLADLRNRENPMEVDRARAVADVARVLVESAKVEVDYIKATAGNNTPFLDAPAPVPVTPATPLPPGYTGVHQHRIK